ncbi:MAG: hypothetical protein IRZ28_16830 [Steroidobacteraceae bacterium]|nr:hypothetical protein [Steroidobacteraceae bacterium]
MDSAKLRRLLADPRRAPMVSWYDPAVLFRSGVRATLAQIFGRHSDRRVIEALGGQPQGAFDYSKDAAGEFWLDYVADLGDGWNSTYAVAYWLSQPELALRVETGTDVITRTGRVLLFGGDQVYPYPFRQAYELGTEKPYATALVGRASRPDVFALPGNHDWYDSLVAFSRTFCRPERGFAGCRTQQTRSYFALRLPHHWWVLGLDLQLGDDVDEPQVQYFQRVAEALEEDARIILCVPEPHWIHERSVEDDPSPDAATTRFLEQEILKRRISVFIAGDLHCYQRHESADGVQKIVWGGGGAFLQPTHVRHRVRLVDGSEPRAVYPPAAVSRRLAWHNLLFPFKNPKFFWLPAVLYSLSAWFASTNLTPHTVSTTGNALRAAVEAAVRDPVDGLWVLLFTGAFVALTDTHVKWYRVAGGIAHAIAHLLLAFAIGWSALQLTTHWTGLPAGALSALLLAGALTFVVSGFAGAWLVGLYLLISLQVFGRHGQHAFSSLRVQDYKGWLRLRIDRDGALTIYAIGIDRVPRRWKNAEASGGAQVEPDDADATPPHLIEQIVVGRKPA